MGLFCTLIAAALSAINFTHFDVSEGLSNNTVMDIIQDGRGVMWFATHNGLSCYDGYDFTYYRHDPEDSTSISSNLLLCLEKDRDGNLWIGGDNGFSLFTPGNKTFFNFLPGVEINDAVCGPDGMLYLSAGQKLTMFDPRKKEVVEGAFPGSIADVRVETFASDGRRLYIGTDCDGVFFYETRSGEIGQIVGVPADILIESLFPGGNGSLFVGTEGKGLYEVDTLSWRVVRHYAVSGNGGLFSGRVRAMETDTGGNLWIGGTGGLNILSPGDAVMEGLRNDPFNPGSLSQNSVRCIYRDDQGGMWLGTFFGGLNYWHPLLPRFETISRTSASNTLTDDIINCFVEDGGDVWIGTNGGGLNRLDGESGTFSRFEGPLDIKAVWVDGIRDRVFAGAHAGGVGILEKGSRALAVIPGTEDKDVYSIIKDPDEDKLWIGALSGLYVYDLGTDRFYEPEGENRKLLRSLRIKTLLHDSSGRLWVGGEKGLAVFEKGPDGLIPSDVPGRFAGMVPRVECFFESSARTVWIGTREGLYCFKRDGDFVRYGKNRGLPGNVVCSIEEDGKGRLWISTDAGLSCFNPMSLSFRNFTSDDGIAGNQFTPGASLRLSSDGKMYFGSVKGIIVFNPEIPKDNPFAPAPLVTSCSVVRNSVSVSFSVPNFVSCRHNTFLYKMKGLDKEWVRTENVRTVTWNRVPPGKYVFMLQAANNDGIWSEETTSFEMEVKPLWYQTVLFKVLVALVSLLILSGFVLAVIRYNKAKDRREMEKRQMQDFVNVSREIRTPLTLIISPLQEMLARSRDVWMRKQIKYVDRNARKLFELAGLLMDYKREELDAFMRKSKREYVEPDMEVAAEEQAASRKKGTLVVIEDNTELREYLRDGLSPDFSVMLMNDASQALEYIRENEVSLIIADIDLPGMGGMEFCSKVKSGKETGHLPVILFSGDREEQIPALKIGADDYLSKPFSVAVLNAKIRNMLRTRLRLEEKISDSVKVDPDKISLTLADEDLIRRAVSVVEANLDNQEFSTEDFAAGMGMSRSNLHIRIKDVTGGSALDFIHRIRFSKACDLIREGRYSISEISDMVGYNTPSYFSTSFKKRFGCLPSEYLKKYPVQDSDQGSSMM